MVCDDDDDDVVQSPAMSAALKVNGAVQTTASAVVLRRELRQRLVCSDCNGTVQAVTMATSCEQWVQRHCAEVDGDGARRAAAATALRRADVDGCSTRRAAAATALRRRRQRQHPT